MKVLILVSCVLAFTSATYQPVWHGPLHYPVIGPNGVPIEPHEVQAARAQHLSALSQAHGGLYHGAGISHNSLPLDTPEVAHAKAQHYHDYAVAAQRNGVHVAPLAHLGGAGHLPVDTPEVQHAKAQHFAAHAAARGNLHGGHGLYGRKRRAIYPQHIPVIGPGGVPVDTPEVQHARAQHLAALGAASVGHPVIPAAHAGYAHDGYAHAGYAHANYIQPVINNGVPLDTPEVQAAKAHHFAAHAQALSHSGGYGAGAYAGGHHYVPHAQIGPDGQPVETHEVQALKAAHFAAHAHVRGY